MQLLDLNLSYFGELNQSEVKEFTRSSSMHTVAFLFHEIIGLTFQNYIDLNLVIELS
jgi:hypothetical protein